MEDRFPGDHNYREFLTRFVERSQAYVDGLNQGAEDGLLKGWLEGMAVPTPRDMISYNETALNAAYQLYLTLGPSEGSQGEPIYGQPVKNKTVESRQTLENLTGTVPGLAPLLEEWDNYASQAGQLMFHFANPPNNKQDPYGGFVFYVDKSTGRVLDGFAIPQDFMDEVASYLQW